MYNILYMHCKLLIVLEILTYITYDTRETRQCVVHHWGFLTAIISGKILSKIRFHLLISEITKFDPASKRKTL